MHAGHKQALLIIGHGLTQLHSGGFWMIGQSGQLHFIGGGSRGRGCIGDTAVFFTGVIAIGVTLQGRHGGQVCFEHGAQRQITPSLPLVLAQGAIGCIGHLQSH